MTAIDGALIQWRGDALSGIEYFRKKYGEPRFIVLREKVPGLDVEQIVRSDVQPGHVLIGVLTNEQIRQRQNHT